MKRPTSIGGGVVSGDKAFPGESEAPSSILFISQDMYKGCVTEPIMETWVFICPSSINHATFALHQMRMTKTVCSLLEAHCLLADICIAELLKITFDKCMNSYLNKIQ